MDIKEPQRDIFSGTAKLARALAEALANNEENVLGPSDSALCVDALRAYAAQDKIGAPPAEAPTVGQIDAGCA